MKKAIISDIHANLEALEAVLEDIDKRGIKEIICCGDIIGYGPDPNMCLKTVRRRGIKSVIGNHDYLVLSRKNFEEHQYRISPRLQPMFRWTDYRLSEEEKDYLKNLPYLLEFDDFLVSHGSAADDELEHFMYIESTDLIDERLDKNFEKLKQKGKKILFYGHRHKPRMFTDKKLSITDSIRRDDKQQVVEIKFRVIPDLYYLVNVGSVGQPRDKDPRACYTVYDGDFISLVRLDYDFKKTQEKLRATDAPEFLREFLANRLELGK